jgi:hypothetical protein
MPKFRIALEGESEDLEVFDDDDLEKSSIDIIEKDNDVSNDIDETNRTIDVVYAMEDLYSIVSRLEAPKPVDIALIKTVANMAVAGTDLPANVLFPANENFTDLSVTLEGIGDKIYNAIKAVGTAVSNVVNKIVVFVKSIIFFFRGRLGKVRTLKINLQKLKSKAKAKSVSVRMRTTDAFRFGRTKELVKDPKDFLVKFKQTMKLNSDLFDVIGSYAENSYGNGLKTLASLTNAEAYEDNYRRMFKDLVSLMGSLDKTTSFTKKQTGDTIVASTTPYLGLYGVQFRYPIKSSYKEDDFKSMKNLSNSFRVNMVDYNNEMDGEIDKYIIFDKIDFTFLDQMLSEIESAIKNSLTFLETILRATGGGTAINAILSIVFHNGLLKLGYLAAREALGFIFASFKLVNVSSSIIRNVSHNVNWCSNYIIDDAIKLCKKAILNTDWVNE